MDDDDECEECEDAAAWMATFADLSTLLLTFFVLLLSFSNMDVQAFREMLGSVRDAWGVQKLVQGPVEAISSTPVELSVKQNDGAGMAPPHEEEPSDKDADDEMLEQITKYVDNAKMADDVEVEMTARGVVVRVKEGALYTSGSADLDEKSKKLLSNIAQMQKKYSDSMQIEGHTDDIPIKSRKYPSNWELSTARAIAALQYLQDEQGLDPAKLGVAGYADSKPLGKNDTEAGRNRNRRVEFVFSRTGAQAPKPKGPSKTQAGRRRKGNQARAFSLPMSGSSPRKPK